MSVDRSKFNKFTLNELKMIFVGARSLSGDRQYREDSLDMQGDINEYCGGENDILSEPDWDKIPTLEDGRVDSRTIAKNRRK